MRSPASLTTAGSRRRAFTGLVSGTLGLVLGASSMEDVAAKKKCPPVQEAQEGQVQEEAPGRNGVCGRIGAQRGVCQLAAPPVDSCPGQKRCGGACIPTSECCTNDQCPAGSLCCTEGCTTANLEPGESCIAGQDSDCCSNNCRPTNCACTQGDWRCGATCRGKACTQDSDCCRGEVCLTPATIGSGRCGGCGKVIDTCQSDADCCHTACTAKPGQTRTQRASHAGQPCEKNVDCRSCYFAGECTVTVNGLTRDICYAGICGCPDECCAASDCPPQKTCVRDADGLNGTCEDLVIGPLNR